MNRKRNIKKINNKKRSRQRKLLLRRSGAIEIASVRAALAQSGFDMKNMA